jgi:DNA-binding NarL/FixJ family response regulator
VIVFTVFDTDERILSAVKGGARGYLLKGDAPREEIFKAVRTVYNGGALLQPLVAGKLLQHMQFPSNDTEPLSTDPDSLTDREKEVLELLAQGFANKEIAQRLSVTERTVKFHVSAILSKLGVSNRTEAAHIALQRGIVKIN